jgi:hypothetical protein
MRSSTACETAVELFRFARGQEQSRARLLARRSSDVGKRPAGRSRSVDRVGDLYRPGRFGEAVEYARGRARLSDPPRGATVVSRARRLAVGTPASVTAWHQTNAGSPWRCGIGSLLATIMPAASTRAAVSAPSTRLPVLLQRGSVHSGSCRALLRAIWSSDVRPIAVAVSDAVLAANVVAATAPSLRGAVT